jgi:DNA-binding beta-propeller fold protein YncE
MRGVRTLLHTTALAALVAATTATAASAARLPLKRVATIPLPGAAVRFDYQSLDPKLDRLYIAHMNASELLVFDVRTRKVVRRLPVPGVHGVIAVPALGRAYASATDVRQVFTIGGRVPSILARAPAGSYPDGLAYEPVHRHVFISDETGGVETVIDWRGRSVATIPLGGEAGNVQYDAGSNKILVAVQTLGQIAVIDPGSNRVVRRVKLPGCYAHGLLIDAPRRLAFVACQQTATLLTVDLRSMKVLGTTAIGQGPDVLAYDAALSRLYVAAESGEVAVFAVAAHGVKRLGLAMLAPRAHTVAVDPRTHLVYFPLEAGTTGTGSPQLLVMRPA